MKEAQMSEYYTIGHSNHNIDIFLQLLKPNDIEILVDVRSYPYSKYSTQYNRETLTETLTENGVRYQYLGKRLGGRPEGDYYDRRGFALYYKIAESDLFRGGIKSLDDIIGQKTTAIMCSEEDPNECHRHLLIGKVMETRGCNVMHIRGDGSIQEPHELMQANCYVQTKLFISEGEEALWKSTRSVLPKKPQRNFSNY